MMVGMDDAEHRPRRKAAWIIAALLATAPILYPLSLGPALWLYNQGYISEATLTVAYYPLLLLADSFPIAHDLFEWYVELWDPS
jgi:hypothetical protein